MYSRALAFSLAAEEMSDQRVEDSGDDHDHEDDV
jgi:hypothetical protein